MVYCDMTLFGGGWTLIQRRVNGHLKFKRNFASYKHGFGDFAENFWLGLEKINALTTSSGISTELYIGLEAFNPASAFAHYSNFSVGTEESGYVLKISGYNSSSSAGDALSGHNNQQFSTHDKDVDIHRDLNCADFYKGGWWYKNCHDSNLNGKYYQSGVIDNPYIFDGVSWYSWLGYRNSMKTTVIAIRPSN